MLQTNMKKPAPYTDEMSQDTDPKYRFFNLMRYTWTLLTVWTVIVVGLVITDYRDFQNFSTELALNTARAHLNKDKSFRFWGTMHGGVYVPVTEDTPPNPYLSHLEDRDIILSSGKQLTLMNPEYMVRHLNETFSELFGISGHITSLKPLRPENGPDAWEIKALEQFEKGVKEVMEIVEDPQDGLVMRLMEPLYVKPGCMKCHGHQGYMVGDIRGGVGIKTPMSGVIMHTKKQLGLHTVSLAVLWLLGCVVIWGGSLSLRRRTTELAISNIELQHEVEERIRAEAALQKESTFTSAILDTAGALILVMDANGVIVRINETCEQICGYSSLEAVGRSFWDFMPSEEKETVIAKFKKLKQDTTPITFEKPLLTKMGQRRIIDWSNTTFQTQGGDLEFVISIGIDITEAKQLQDQLLHSEKLSAVGKLSASIAHEINNPLFGIRNVLVRLKEKAGLDDSNQEFTELAIQECDRIKNLIRDLQDFNRPTSGMMIPMNVHKIIDTMLLLTRKEFEKKRIKVVKNYSDDVREVAAIADQMKQVFLNLLNNAGEAIDKNGTITITTEAAPDYNGIVISIGDTGVGIQPQDLKHIFEPFFTTKAAVKGTGLGLSVTYGIIKRHGGEITIESIPGQGAECTIFLPASGVKE